MIRGLRAPVCGLICKQAGKACVNKLKPPAQTADTEAMSRRSTLLVGALLLALLSALVGKGAEPRQPAPKGNPARQEDRTSIKRIRTLC